MSPYSLSCSLVLSSAFDRKAILFKLQSVINILIFLILIFTALHGMQTRSSDENNLSVRPSVCHTREL